MEDNGTVASKFWMSFNLEVNFMPCRITHEAGE